MVQRHRHPLTNIDDLGNINSFPMMRIRAIDMATNLPRSFLDIVVPASSEMNCASCHETATFVVPGVTASDAAPPPRIGPPPGANLLQDTDFSSNPNANIRVRKNVLILHDALGSYGGPIPVIPVTLRPLIRGIIPLGGLSGGNANTLRQVPLFQGPGSGRDRPWRTASRPPLSLPGHAQAPRHRLAMMDTTYVIPIPGAYSTPPTPSECYYCHPGNDTQCLRSVMAVKGMSCQNCHGDLQAIAGFTSQLATVPGFVDSYLPNVSDQPALRSI